MGSKILGWIMATITLSVLLIGCIATLYFLGVSAMLGVTTQSICFGIVIVLVVLGAGFVAMNASSVFLDKNY